MTEVRGVDTLARTLRQGADDLADEDALSALAADLVAREAKPRTPRRSGALMATVRSEAGSVVAGSRTVVYAGVILWGSTRRHIRANPWIPEAAQRSESDVADLIRGQVVKIAERVKGQ